MAPHQERQAPAVTGLVWLTEGSLLGLPDRSQDPRLHVRHQGPDADEGRLREVRQKGGQGWRCQEARPAYEGARSPSGHALVTSSPTSRILELTRTATCQTSVHRFHRGEMTQQPRAGSLPTAAG